MIELDREKILQIVHDPGDTTYLTHNFHPYSAKFIPQIPGHLISTLSAENELILDPFCGSGTTLVEAKLLGRRSIGIDIHPLGAFMSRVKSTKIPSDELSKVPFLLSIIEQRIEIYVRHQNSDGTLLDHIKSNNDVTEFDYLLPDFKNRDHWFQQNVLHELAIIKTSIETAEISRNLKDFLLLGFSSIIVNVSNQESETRYASLEKNVLSFHTFQTFRKKIIDMKRRMSDFNEAASECEAVSYNADIRELDFLEDNIADVIVTSPPYPNTYDYYLYHKHRMSWLDMEWEFLKQDEIGSRLKHSSWRMGIEPYLQDMTKGFENLQRILKPDGFFVIIIGDSIIKKEFLRGDEIVAMLARPTGFKILDSIDYDLGLASRTFNRAFRNKSKREHIILLQNRK